jgi:hypothetical protein
MKKLITLLAVTASFAVLTPAAVQAGDHHSSSRSSHGSGHGSGHGSSSHGGGLRSVTAPGMAATSPTLRAMAAATTPAMVVTQPYRPSYGNGGSHNSGHGSGARLQPRQQWWCAHQPARFSYRLWWPFRSSLTQGVESLFPNKPAGEWMLRRVFCFDGKICLMRFSPCRP